MTFSCTSSPQEKASHDMKSLGSDRSSEGCITSAGYSWCEKTQQCERSWELTVKEKLKKDPASFKEFCGNSE